MQYLINVDRAKSLYLDEKGARCPNSKHKNDYFFIGGIEVYNHDKKQIVDFVRSFKSKLHPGETGSSWELKGAKSPSFADNSFDTAKDKWQLWATELAKNNINYKIYGSFIKLSEYKKQYPDATEKNVIKTAFLDVVERFTNYGCVESTNVHGYDKMLLPSNLYFDNVDNLQEDSILEAFQDHLSKYGFLAENFGIGSKLTLLDNNDFDLEDELLMQFVDMQIYVLTRFLRPVTRNKDTGRGEVLVKYQEYLDQLPKIKSGEIVLTTEELKDISEYYYRILPVLCDLQNRFHRFGSAKGVQITSLSLIADKVYDDFGIDAYHDLAHSNSSMTYLPNSKLFNILNSD